MEEKKKFKLAIVDDHNLFRKGLIKLINLADKDGRYSVLFEANNGYDLKDKLNSRNLPDIVLMDIYMPDMDGYEAVEWMQKQYPDIKILVVSMFESEDAIMKMLRLGVNGYLSKDIEVEDMNMALEAVANKGFYYPGFVTGIMAGAIKDNNQSGGTNPDDKTGKGLGASLTENEAEFLKLACTELTYQEIADKMILSPKTIDRYREALFAKFKVTSRVGLAMFAVKHGLVKP
jgi:DNA-binding NarL/FixJ family response regulator